jgi:hypothetical protein
MAFSKSQTPYNKRMQLAARGLWFAIVVTGGRPSQRRLVGGFAAGRRAVYGRFTAVGS